MHLLVQRCRDRCSILMSRCRAPPVSALVSLSMCVPVLTTFPLSPLCINHRPTHSLSLHHRPTLSLSLQEIHPVARRRLSRSPTLSSSSRMAPKVEVIDLSAGFSDESSEPSCEECQMDQDLNMTIKGPRWAAEDSYDSFCVNPNRVALLPEQVVILENICDEKEPRIPLYVCTIREAQIAEEGKGKMYFNKDYTKTYLRRYMTRTGYDMRVYYGKAKKMTEVKIKMDKANRYAIMTSNWMFVVDDQDYGEREVLMFWFRRTQDNRLKLCVDRIEPDAFGLGTQKHLLLLEAAGL